MVYHKSATMVALLWSAMPSWKIIFHLVPGIDIHITKKLKTMPAHMQKLCPNIFPKILLIEKFLIDSVFVHFIKISISQDFFYSGSFVFNILKVFMTIITEFFRLSFSWQIVALETLPYLLKTPKQCPHKTCTLLIKYLPL